MPYSLFHFAGQMSARSGCVVLAVTPVREPRFDADSRSSTACSQIISIVRGVARHHDGAGLFVTQPCFLSSWHHRRSVLLGRASKWHCPVSGDQGWTTKPALTLILRRSRTGTVWFYTSTSNKRAARPKLYTMSLTRDLKLMYSRFTLVSISINL